MISFYLGTINDLSNIHKLCYFIKFLRPFRLNSEIVSSFHILIMMGYSGRKLITIQDMLAREYYRFIFLPHNGEYSLVISPHQQSATIFPCIHIYLEAKH